MKEQSNTKQPSWSFILFVLSFIPYLYIVTSSIFGVEFFFSEAHGFEGALVAIIVGTTGYPVFPELLIFQVIYLIVKYKYFSTLQVKITKWIIGILLLLIIVPSTIYQIRDSINDKKEKDSSTIIINNYLKESFGDLANDMHITGSAYAGDEYSIMTPLLKESFRVWLNEDKTKVTSNNFIEKYADEKDLNSKMSYKIKEKYNLPSNYKPEITIDNFNIEDIGNEEAILDHCIYNIESIHLTFGSFSKDETVKTIVEYYKKYHNKLKPYLHLGDQNFIIKTSRKTVVYITSSKEANGNIRMNFYIYENDKDSLEIVIYNTFNNKVIKDEKIR